jgi:hypothetical protein
MSIWQRRLIPALILFLTLVITSLSSTPGVAAGPTLQLITPPEAQSALLPLDLPVQISQAANLGAWEFDLQYDPALLTITGITVGDFFARSADCDPAAGRCAILLGPIAEDEGLFSAGAVSYGQGSGANGDGLLATLHLQPNGIGGVTQLRFTAALLTDPSATSAITPATVDASLELVAPSFNTQVYLPVVSR